jgi:hypothetical protein
VRRLVDEGGSLRVRDVLRRVSRPSAAPVPGLPAETANKLDGEMFALITFILLLVR